MFGTPKYVKIKKSDFEELKREFENLRKLNRQYKNHIDVLLKHNEMLKREIDDLKKDELFFDKIQELKEENQTLKDEIKVLKAKKEFYEKFCDDILQEYKKLKNEEEKTEYIEKIDFLV